MPVFRCRTLIPKCDYPWEEVEAETAEDAGQEYHSHRANHFQSLQYLPEEGPSIFFAKIEVEGHKPFISRIFYSGIGRKGGVKLSRKDRLAKIAKALEWKDDPEDLIAEGWENEKTEWF